MVHPSVAMALRKNKTVRYGVPMLVNNFYIPYFSFDKVKSQPIKNCRTNVYINLLYMSSSWEHLVLK
uniref:Uncharacterized protein n=1 Tax=Labrus bergylta TaxID=56723 RepID=A0A3Q3FG29_9LABR